MSEAKHTPGPWTWGEDWPEMDKLDSDTFWDECPKYAMLGLVGSDGEDIIPIRIDHRSPEWDSSLPLCPKPADRALISAAPDLLVACRKSLRALGGYDPNDLAFESDLCGELRAAIAKAEGGAA